VSASKDTGNERDITFPAPPGSADRKRRLIGHLRHELRTCLTAIIGYTEHLIEELASDTPSEVEHALLALKVSGDALLSEVNGRLAIDAVNSLVGDALLSVIQDLRAICLAEAQKIEATCVSLIKASERDQRFGPIPLLCRIQAAGTMLNNLLEAYSLDASATTPWAGLPVSRSAPWTTTAGAAKAAERRGGRILIADDNSISRDLLRRLLTQRGYQIEEASSGHLALELIRKHDYDVILLDLMMPDLDGLSVLLTLSQEGRLGYTPIIMLSASDEVEGAVRCIECGADDYVAKPFNMVLLDARIRLALELKRHRTRERAYLSTLEEYGAKAAAPATADERLVSPKLPHDR
jgi:CheY-like chemotaxis protein